MATRAHELLDKCILEYYTVVTGGSATVGYGVKLDTTDKQVTITAAVGDNAIGIALNTAAALAAVRVALLGQGICKAAVGTAGVTMGGPVTYASDGVVDATVGGGTTKLVCYGQAQQTGVVGDLIGLNLGMACFTVTT